MNVIEAIVSQTELMRDPHLVIVIDGKPLTAILDEQFSGERLGGLIPAIPWVDEATERRIAVERFLPEPGIVANAPVLVCPDDLDFSCTVIIAEVRRVGEEVHWMRIGRDRTPIPWMINVEEGWRENVGRDVEWFDGIGGYRFPLPQYQACLAMLMEEITSPPSL